MPSLLLGAACGRDSVPLFRLLIINYHSNVVTLSEMFFCFSCGRVPNGNRVEMNSKTNDFPFLQISRGSSLSQSNEVQDTHVGAL